MNIIQKSHVLEQNLNTLEGEYRQENRPHTADRVRQVRIELMASPDTAARLFDMLQKWTPATARARVGGSFGT